MGKILNTTHMLNGMAASVASYAAWPSLIGAEMMVNGDCSSATGWTLPTGVAIALGKMTLTTAPTAEISNSGPIGAAMVEGAAYRCVFTIDTISLGALTQIVGQTIGTQRSSAGTFSEDLIAVGIADDGGWRIYESTAPTTCQLDNFSVKSVGLLGVEADWAASSANAYFQAGPPDSIYFDSAVANDKVELTGSAKTAFDAAVSSNTACTVTLYTSDGAPLDGTIGVKMKGGTKVNFSFSATPGESVSHTVTSGSGSGFEVIAGGDNPAGAVVRVVIVLA